MILPIIGAWNGHTDASRDLALDIAAALDAAFGKREAAAAAMDIHPADLSRQLSGRDPLNVYRLAGLGVTFWLQFLIARARRIGAEILTADQRQLLMGAAAYGPRMLRAVLSTERKRA